MKGAGLFKRTSQSGSSFEGGRGADAADECAETKADVAAAAAAVEEGIGGGPKEPPADSPRGSAAEEEGRTSSTSGDGVARNAGLLLPLFFCMVVADGSGEL